MCSANWLHGRRDSILRRHLELDSETSLVVEIMRRYCWDGSGGKFSWVQCQPCLNFCLSKLADNETPLFISGETLCCASLFKCASFAGLLGRRNRVTESLLSTRPTWSPCDIIIRRDVCDLLEKISWKRCRLQLNQIFLCTILQWNRIICKRYTSLDALNYEKHPQNGFHFEGWKFKNSYM